MSNEETQSYVHENVEVVLTGRTASRKLTSGKIDALVEITPKDSAIGYWKKWVSHNTLYQVNE